MGSATCRYCQRPILWATNTTTGRSVPMEPETDRLGEYVGYRAVDGKLLVAKYDPENVAHRPAAEAGRRYRPHRQACAGMNREVTVDKCQVPKCCDTPPLDGVACALHEFALTEELVVRLRRLYLEQPRSSEHRRAVEEAASILRRVEFGAEHKFQGGRPR